MVDPEGSRTLVSALLPPGVGHASGISGISMQDYNQLLLIWLYFQTVVAWAKAIFTDYTKFMKGLDWGILYNKYHNNTYDPVKFASEVKRLIADKDVTKNSGIYEYLLSGDEKFLQIRAFDDDQKMEAYVRQNGICPKCGEHFEFDEMQGDHITPWSKCGKTISENCQMLCADRNRRKSNA